MQDLEIEKLIIAEEKRQKSGLRTDTK